MTTTPRDPNTSPKLKPWHLDRAVFREAPGEQAIVQLDDVQNPETLAERFAAELVRRLQRRLLETTQALPQEIVVGAFHGLQALLGARRPAYQPAIGGERRAELTPAAAAGDDQRARHSIQAAAALAHRVVLARHLLGVGLSEIARTAPAAVLVLLLDHLGEVLDLELGLELG